MKNDKELLKELVEYFDEVMVDVEEGKPFEKVEIPDYSGHELEQHKNEIKISIT